MFERQQHTIVARKVFNACVCVHTAEYGGGGAIESIRWRMGASPFLQRYTRLRRVGIGKGLLCSMVSIILAPESRFLVDDRSFGAIEYDITVKAEEGRAARAALGRRLSKHS